MRIQGVKKKRHVFKSGGDGTRYNNFVQRTRGCNPFNLSKITGYLTPIKTRIFVHNFSKNDDILKFQQIYLTFWEM